jgi:RanBP1 domain
MATVGVWCHAVMPGTRMQEHSGNEKSIVWSAVDFADEEQRTEMFCARFASQDRESALCACFQPCTLLLCCA